MYVYRLLVCAPTNAAVDMLLGKLISTGLFHKSVMKRLVGYNYYIGSSYNMDYDEYCVLPELENSDHVTNEPGNMEYLTILLNKIFVYLL